MSKNEKHDHPERAKYAPKALLAIVVIVLGIIAFNLLYPSLGIINPWNMSTTFLYEAVFTFIIGALTLIPGSRGYSTISREGKKWIVIVAMTVVVVLLILSALTAML
jgi:nicotinamide riboside transporter PnuC